MTNEGRHELLEERCKLFFVELRFQQEGVVSFFGMDALVLGLDSILDESAVEVRDSVGGEAIIRADGEEHEGDAVFGKAAETGICATAGGSLQVKGRPHVDDADVGVGIKTLGKLGALVEHVALSTFLWGKPSEQPFAVRVAIFAGAFS